MGSLEIISHNITMIMIMKTTLFWKLINDWSSIRKCPVVIEYHVNIMITCHDCYKMAKPQCYTETYNCVCKQIFTKEYDSLITLWKSRECFFFLFPTLSMKNYLYVSMDLERKGSHRPCILKQFGLLKVNRS